MELHQMFNHLGEEATSPNRNNQTPSTAFSAVTGLVMGGKRIPPKRRSTLVEAPLRNAETSLIGQTFRLGTSTEDNSRAADISGIAFQPPS
jgi:hypothetical protein